MNSAADECLSYLETNSQRESACLFGLRHNWISIAGCLAFKYGGRKRTRDRCIARSIGVDMAKNCGSRSVLDSWESDRMNKGIGILYVCG